MSQSGLRRLACLWAPGNRSVCKESSHLWSEFRYVLGSDFKCKYISLKSLSLISNPINGAPLDLDRMLCRHLQLNPFQAELLIYCSELYSLAWHVAWLLLHFQVPKGASTQTSPFLLIQAYLVLQIPHLPNISYIFLLLGGCAFSLWCLSRTVVVSPPQPHADLHGACGW